MPLFNMTQLRAALSSGQRLVGLDLGSRTVGLALSDVGLLLATPCGTMPRGRLGEMAVAIRRVAAAEGVGGLVIGLPLSMDGTLGRAAQAARDFSHALSSATGLPAALWDERLSSAAVNRMLIAEADVSRRRRRALVDAAAATYILQGALDGSAPGRGDWSNAKNGQ